MPKRLMIALALTALVMAACKSGGSMSPTPSGAPVSPSPNPKIKKATILVTISGTPQPQIPVAASTPRSKTSPRPGKPFDTEITNKKGFAHFHMLKPDKTYCWVAKLGPGQTASECAGWAIWQGGEIILGT
jgi:hypothetical protein